MNLFVKGMRGLGDSIYIRPFLKNTKQFYDSMWLETPYPELYEDIPGLHFVKPATRLHAQKRNVDRQPESRWSVAPKRIPGIRINYYQGGRTTIRGGTIIAGIESCFPHRGEFRFDLPDFRPFADIPAGSDRPIAIVRPVSLRTEWYSPARNPLPEYVAEIAALLRETHVVISLADFLPGIEWPIEPLPPADIVLHSGELNVAETLGLVQCANVVVGGVGWIVPAGIAASVNTFTVFGGMLSTNGPNVITDPRMDLSKFGYAIPDEPCFCGRNTHTCNKTITTLRSQWNAFASRRSLPLFPG